MHLEAERRGDKISIRRKGFGPSRKRRHPTGYKQKEIGFRESEQEMVQSVCSTAIILGICLKGERKSDDDLSLNTCQYRWQCYRRKLCYIATVNLKLMIYDIL